MQEHSVSWVLETFGSFLVLRICSLKVVWNGKSCEDSHTLVPHVEDRTHRLDEGDVIGVEMVGAHGVVEGQVAGVIVQQHAKAAQVWGRLDGHLFAVVAHHPGVVAATQHPRGSVFANPLMLGGSLVCNAHSKP